MTITATAVPIEQIKAAAHLPRNPGLVAAQLPRNPRRVPIEKIEGAAHLPHNSRRVPIERIEEAAHLPRNSKRRATLAQKGKKLPYNVKPGTQLQYAHRATQSEARALER